MTELLSLSLAKILPFEVHKYFHWLSFLFLLIVWFTMNGMCAKNKNTYMRGASKQ